MPIIQHSPDRIKCHAHRKCSNEKQYTNRRCIFCLRRTECHSSLMILNATVWPDWAIFGSVNILIKEMSCVYKHTHSVRCERSSFSGLELNHHRSLIRYYRYNPSDQKKENEFDASNEAAKMKKEDAFKANGGLLLFSFILSLMIRKKNGRNKKKNTKPGGRWICEGKWTE